MTVIDVHAHWMPARFTERVEQAAASDADFARQFGALFGATRTGLTDVAELLRGMDDAGVDASLLSVPPPAAAVPAAEPATQLAREFNDELMSAVAAHPDRLRAVLSLPLTDVDGACAEVQRWVDHEQLAGVCLPVSAGHTGSDAACFEPLYAVCAEFNVPVFLHPALDVASTQFAQWNLHSAIGGPTATTVAAVRLALSGVLDRYPGLTVIVPHLGGAIPYLFGRLNDQSASRLTQHELSYYLRERLLYDTCAFHPPALHCALATVGAERLLLGTDYPFRGRISRATCELREQLDGPVKEMVMGGNARRLLMTRTAGIRQHFRRSEEATCQSR